MNENQKELILALWGRVTAENPDMNKHEAACIVKGWLDKNPSAIQNYLTEDFTAPPPKNKFTKPLSSLSRFEIFSILYGQKPSTELPRGSVYTSLEGVTNPKNWKKTK